MKSALIDKIRVFVTNAQTNLPGHSLVKFETGDENSIMVRAFKRNILSVLFGLSLTPQANAQGLQCFAGRLQDKERNVVVEEKTPKDFATSETTLVQYGQTYSVRKYRVEIENFVVEGILFLDSGIAAELSITDRTTGTVAQVKEHGTVRLNMSSPRAGGLINIAATCTQ